MDGRPPNLKTLGELRLEGVIASLGSPRKALALLAFLARRAPRRVRREELMALFWGDRPEARARQSVRQVLLDLRQVLPQAFQADNELVGLNGGLVVDVIEFDRDIAAGRYEQAVQRWDGEFLAGVEDAGGEEFRIWLEQEREALRRKLALALERLIEQSSARQDWDAAVRWADVWSSAIPYDERAQIRLLEALARAGKVAEARARHASFVARLHHEVELEPSAELQRAAQNLDHPAQVRDEPAHSAARPATLPQPSSLEAARSAVEAGGFSAVLLQCDDAALRTRTISDFLHDRADCVLLQATGQAGAPLSTMRRLFAELRFAPGLSGAPDAALAELSALVPEIRERFPRLPDATVADALPGALAQVLADVAAEAKVVVWLDQAGAADAASVDLLRALLRCKPAGVLVLLSDAGARIESSGLKHCAVTHRVSLKPDIRPARRRRVRIAALAAAAFVLTSGFFALLKLPARPAPTADQLVVLPFDLHGTDRYTYLREGLAELLSTSLDGVSAWRTVDARSTLRQVSAGDVALDRERGQALAERLGADLYVVGSIVEAGSALRVQATLYRRSTARPLVRAAADGTAEELFRLVDKLAEQILSHVERPAARLSRIAAVTTDSLAALKSYLDGEAALRKFLVRDAFDAFHRAVVIDSTFSLAWYGQATAASWLLAPEHALAAADAAVRHAGRLGPRDRALVDMLRAYLAGHAEEAERLARMVLAYYPDDVERRMQLAEILFHFSWRRGGSFTAAERELRRVLAADPEYAPAMVHLAQIALHAGRTAEADTLTRHLMREYGDHPSGAWISALNAAATNNSQALTSSFRRLYDAGDWWLTLALWDLGTYAPDLTAAERAALLLADAGRTKSTRAMGHLARAHIELARGRWQNARAELSQIAPLHREWFLEYSALLAAAPFLPVDARQHDGLRARLIEWDADGIVAPTRPPDPRPWTTVHDGVHGDIRHYLVGVLSLRAGDLQEVANQAALLSRRTSAAGGTALARGQAASLRAQVLRLEGKPHEALALLDSTVVEAPFEFAMGSAFWSQALERYLRAELLIEVGQYTAARAVLRSFGETSLLDAVYRAPAEMKLAQIAERTGHVDDALAHYRRFIDMWHDSDRELRPLIVEAQRRIEQLQVTRRSVRP